MGLVIPNTTGSLQPQPVSDINYNTTNIQSSSIQPVSPTYGQTFSPSAYLSSPTEEHLPTTVNTQSKSIKRRSSSQSSSTNVTASKPRKPCNCKNSQCLKLYCDCFANGEFCRESCNCQNCKNSFQHEEDRGRAIKV
jgi:hypothetical protein